MSSPVVSDDGDTRVHIDTEGEIFVQVIDLLSRVGEGDVGESDDRRRELGDVLELEGEDLGLGDLLDETGSLHLVDDLRRGKKKGEEVSEEEGEKESSSTRREKNEPSAWTWPA